MRKFVIGFAVVAVIALAVYVHHRSHQLKPALETVYAGNRQVTIWSSTAQVREAVATANFGEPLAVVARYNDEVQVRTASGITGWANAGDLLPEEFWHKAQALDSKTAAMPVEARGHTRVLSNMHIDAGRETARIRQLNKNIPVELFERESVSVPGSNANQASTDVSGTKEGAASESLPEAKKEDWWLVRAHFPDETAQAGWVLGRFIDLDIPEPLSDYASAAGMRIVAYFELNRVPDEDSGTKPQYLVLGAKGSEGQACDFTVLRVFTWGNQQQRYETAFVESNVCGKLPVRLTQAPDGDVSFAFQEFADGTPQERTYRMHQTVVRRVGTPLKGGQKPARPKARITVRADGKRISAPHPLHHR